MPMILVFILRTIAFKQLKIKRYREIGNQVYLFLKNKLKLPINREKSGIRTPSTFKILGYGFTSNFEKGSKGQYQLIVLDKSWEKVKASIKEITRKTKPSSFDKRIAELKLLQRGWLNYFKLGNIVSKLKAIDRFGYANGSGTAFGRIRAEHESAKSQAVRLSRKA